MRNTRMSWSTVGFVAATLVCFGTSFEAFAGVKLNPYEWIVERNPFGLKPPSPVIEEVPAPVAPPVPLATVEVAGITSILSSPRALLEIVPGPGKPMLKPILGVGERLDSVEIISINMEQNEVVLRNGTLITNVPLRVAKAGLPSPPAGVPTGLGIPARLPGGSPMGSRGGVALGGGVTIPDRARIPTLPALPQVGRFFQPPNPTVQ